MATVLNRLEFKQNYAKYWQGLFIVLNPKRIPKDQQECNIGQALSERLCNIDKGSRGQHVPSILGNLINDHSALTLTHIEILFTDYLKIDVVRTLLNFCRNRRVCFAWPGQWYDGKLLYVTPEYPEYYECDTKLLNDLYIIVD